MSTSYDAGPDSPGHEPPGREPGQESGRESGHDSVSGDPAGGPRVDLGEQAGHLGSLRRSRSDRMIGGVAGGLGRHFDIDPTLFRVLFAVTTCFAGAGLLLYLVLWLLVPDELSGRAGIDVRPETRQVLVIVAAALSVVVLVGGTWGPWGHSWALALVLLVVGAVLLARDRSPSRAGAAAPPPAPPSTHGSGTTATAPVAEWAGPRSANSAGTGAEGTGAERTTGGTPPADRPVPPPASRRPRRTGMVLFWPTLALLAIGLGIVGLVDRHHAVAISTYPALALAVVGGMLVLGAFVGRPGGLVLLGVLSALALATSLVTHSLTGRTGDLHPSPTTAAAVSSSYRLSSGAIHLDLTRVTDPSALDGRTITLRVNAGELDVVVPSDVTVVAHGRVSYAGQVALPGEKVSGTGGVQQTRTLAADIPNAPTLTLDLRAGVGVVQVEQE